MVTTLLFISAVGFTAFAARKMGGRGQLALVFFWIALALALYFLKLALFGVAMAVLLYGAWRSRLAGVLGFKRAAQQTAMAAIAEVHRKTN